MEAYQRLRPNSIIEACECPSVNGLLLVDLLTDNPLHCDFCRKEVDPERLQLSVEETESIAAWFSAADALFRLWLDSGEYESYAKSCMLDPQGQVNRDGLAIAEMLSKRVPTRWWFFSDTDDGVPIRCPMCSELLDTEVKWGTGRCRTCAIHL
jgi:hypothetical protein